MVYYLLFWLCWVFVAAQALPLVAMSRGGNSLVAVLRHLIAVASLVAERGLWDIQASGVVALEPWSAHEQ